MIKEISDKNGILAIIIPANFNKEGISFCTPNDFSQQLAHMHHPKGKAIQPHVHNLVKRKVNYTLEVLFIKKGKLQVDFYSEEQKYLKSCLLCAGDTILLARGGHGFEVIEEVEMIEVKQGPYAGDKDKTRFDAKPKRIKYDSGK
jgi:mannose-6-phosphate isomerase-like protein (cupin superfamily)